MGRVLILVESLSAALLLVALVTAWAGRSPRGLRRWGVPLAVVLIVAVPAALTVYGMSLLNGMGTVSLTSFVAVIVWTLAFVVGSIIVVPATLRASADPTATWSLRSLTIAFVAAVVLTAITTSNLDVAAKGQLAAVRVEAGAKALALAPPRAPEGQNAAVGYRKAFAALTPPDQLPALLRDRASAWQSYDRAAFDANDREQKEFLEGQQRGLTLIREAAAVPHCSFDRDWLTDTSPIDLPLPELPHLRHAATVLAYDALARANRGDSKGAIDDIAAIFGMARHVRHPMLIDLITAVAIERTGAKVLEDVLAVAPPKADELTRLNIGAGEPYREFHRRTFAMEEAWGMAAIVMVATGKAAGSPGLKEEFGMDSFGESLLATHLYRVFFLEDDLATYRRHIRTMRENAARPTPQMFEGFDKHEQEIRSTRGGGIMSGLLLPAAHRVMYAAIEGDATRGLVRLAVASAAYKAKHGKHPEKLTDLVPTFITEVPADPYDGRPLRLRSLDGGLVLYSIGRDRDDDGGRPWDVKTEDGDLVFRLR